MALPKPVEESPLTSLAIGNCVGMGNPYGSQAKAALEERLEASGPSKKCMIDANGTSAVSNKSKKAKQNPPADISKDRPVAEASPPPSDVRTAAEPRKIRCVIVRTEEEEEALYNNAIVIDDMSEKSGDEAGSKASGPESAEDERTRLMKEWVSPVYAFFDPTPRITVQPVPLLQVWVFLGVGVGVDLPTPMGSPMQIPNWRVLGGLRDVVHASSPVKDPKVEQESTLALNTATNINVWDQGDTVLEKMAENITFHTANENSGITSESDDGDDRPWITVGRKCLCGGNIYEQQAKTPEGLTSEQIEMVNKANSKLTEKEHLSIERQEMNVSRRELSHPMVGSDPRGEGTSKGKGVDPANWGALTDDEDINLEEQRAALESYHKAKEVAERLDHYASSEENKESWLGDGVQNSSMLQDIFELAAREWRAVEAAVQRAETRLHKEYKEKSKEVLARPQSSTKWTRIQDPPEMVDDPVNRLVSKVVNPETSKKEWHHTPKAMEPGRTKTSKKCSKGKQTTLKPIAPTTYDGVVDSQAFHQFITEGMAYVKDGRVKPKKRVFVLLHFLKGKAHEFYIQEVSGDPYRWRLKEFFTKMFNYCFPINF
ncbi:uncharacterized protein EDB93DRAFT_1100283 [Suillus bovinus]|uniref:uncharacterized protein n=1 Tax=Suillus bovinus TaxID=48563 RepID=UPI001B86B686|nr:uncharacterized protein EDB93DRAFT_1100283 [Suillus bovinus]KAG2158627.1 hypothetical protein EDB93DRAFT_1100283 [Suillus bovinus]